MVLLNFLCMHACDCGIFWSICFVTLNVEKIEHQYLPYYLTVPTTPKSPTFVMVPLTQPPVLVTQPPCEEVARCIKSCRYGYRVEHTNSNTECPECRCIIRTCLRSIMPEVIKHFSCSTQLRMKYHAHKC